MEEIISMDYRIRNVFDEHEFFSSLGRAVNFDDRVLSLFGLSSLVNGKYSNSHPNPYLTSFMNRTTLLHLVITDPQKQQSSGLFKTTIIDQCYDERVAYFKKCPLKGDIINILCKRDIDESRKKDLQQRNSLCALEILEWD